LCQIWAQSLARSIPDAAREVAMQNVFESLSCLGE